MYSIGRGRYVLLILASAFHVTSCPLVAASNFQHFVIIHDLRFADARQHTEKSCVCVCPTRYHWLRCCLFYDMASSVPYILRDWQPTSVVNKSSDHGSPPVKIISDMDIGQIRIVWKRLLYVKYSLHIKVANNHHEASSLIFTKIKGNTDLSVIWKTGDENSK